ncbi:RadC family protein [Legionella jamestowniensis]|uniref:DNA repair protein RadC n=1 Tax=Legionella jamestowniensis TaxID=455 RepID=A0A0W0UKM9_9GAMM|nr:DNA repair protein RadC [Legionella jamestowniensis]KTD08300.1 DNA repair protein RadC [Legionella jamestowniensis]SFL49453.1 DNA repair protein RadC [Legionella jamestowniensis DSM 19215]
MTQLPVLPPPFRVREKLLSQGAENLSDAELLAVFISSGSRKKSCMQLALDLIKQLGDLRAILNAEPQAFNQVAGLGMVRYLQLQAAREICRRSDFISLQKKTTLTNSQQTYAYLKRQLRDRKNETFVALFLDSQHRVLAYEELFSGTINAANVYPRPIIDKIFKLNAAAVILAHNHPSGIVEASTADLAVTKRLSHALELIDVRLLDHLIIGDNEVYSIMSNAKWPCN